MKKIKIGKYEIRMKVAGDSISVRVHHFGSELPFVGTILYQTGKDTTDAEMWAISKINQDIEGKQEENVLSFHPRQDEQDVYAVLENTMYEGYSDDIKSFSTLALAQDYVERNRDRLQSDQSFEVKKIPIIKL